MSDPRYQFQNPWVKTYRWWRYKPLYFVRSLWRVFWWATADRAKPAPWITDAEGESESLTRWRTLEMVWYCSMGQASMKMQHYYTTAEVFGGDDE